MKIKAKSRASLSSSSEIVNLVKASFCIVRAVKSYVQQVRVPFPTESLFNDEVKAMQSVNRVQLKVELEIISQLLSSLRPILLRLPSLVIRF